jgi:tRNA (adenine22-N1)-methyltransferase
MKLPISKRLLACVAQVPQGARVADIGTDHGYLPIWLLKSGIINEAIAADIGKGPLSSAKENALRHSFYIY